MALIPLCPPSQGRCCFVSLRIELLLLEGRAAAGGAEWKCQPRFRRKPATPVYNFNLTPLLLKANILFFSCQLLYRSMKFSRLISGIRSNIHILDTTPPGITIYTNPLDHLLSPFHLDILNPPFPPLKKPPIFPSSFLSLFPSTAHSQRP